MKEAAMYLGAVVLFLAFMAGVVYVVVTGKSSLNAAGADVQVIEVEGVKCVRLITSEGAAISCDWRAK